MRRLATLSAALLVAAVLAATGSPTTPATPHEFPTLYVNYALNCTFTIADDSGNPVSSMAPGTYQVAVTTPVMFSLVNTQNLAPGSFNGCKGYVQFQLTGPGVYLYTTLFQGCESFQVLSSEEFKASSTYVAQDNNQPSVARVVLTTTATGAPVSPPSPQGTGTGKGTPSTSVVGEGLTPARTTFQGALAAAVSPAGALQLTYKGKNVATLKAGRYKLSVDDQSAKSGFIVQEIRKAATTVAGGSFTGKRSVTIDLKAGQWYYYPSAGAKRTYFLVIS